MASSSVQSCRCLPGDACWPSSDVWQELNSTVHGRLIATDPIASVCHGSQYNQTACASLQTGWDEPKTFYPTPADIMDPYTQNQSCDPFTSPSKPCELGNLASYSLNVSGAADVATGLHFAQRHNIRITVKNTGHDYSGKSAGKGSLGLWTHNLKSVKFFNYSSTEYEGPAAKVGAGIQGYELYTAASKQGLRIVGGECATVGFAGGYVAGGGHSALASTYGLAADQILEWEVVTANGTHLIATPLQNSDLYWALSGGGGGVFGVTLSVTVKAHPEGAVGGAFLQFTTANNDPEALWDGVTAFHASLPAIVDSGASALYSISNTSFTMIPLTSPGSNEDDISSLLQPWLSKLQQLNITYELTTTVFSTYFEHFDHYFGPLPFGNPLINPIAYTLGGRIIPRAVVQNDTSNVELTDAFRKCVYLGGGYMTGGVALKVTHDVAGNNASSNAVLPAWRDAIVTVLAFAPWDYRSTLASNYAAEDYLLNVTIPAFKALAPNGGAYLNEANAKQADWQTSFYGVNYGRLESIKGKYDPHDLFYAVTGVGSERWVLTDDQRLCRKE